MSNRSRWGWWAFEKDFMEKEVVSHERELGRRVLGQGTMCRGGGVVGFCRDGQGAVRVEGGLGPGAGSL